MYFFIDKDCYLPDLITLEKRNLLTKRCTLVADNVIFPGAPDYLEYVGINSTLTSPPLWKTELQELMFERRGFETGFKETKDAMAISRRVG